MLTAPSDLLWVSHILWSFVSDSSVTTYATISGAGGKVSAQKYGLHLNQLGELYLF